MEGREVPTERGSAWWGEHPVDYALSTIHRTWFGRRRASTRSGLRYRLTYRLDGRTDRVEFASEQARENFTNASLSRRSTGDGSADLELLGVAPPLAEYVGEPLEAVTFVADYLQLQFCGVNENFYVWPGVHRDGAAFQPSAPGYRDALCAFIGDEVTSTDVFVDDGFVITFSHGEIVVTAEQLRDGHPRTPEVIDRWFNAGDVPFDRPS